MCVIGEADGYREDDLEQLVIGIRRQWKAFQGDGLLQVPVIQEKATAS